MPRIVLAGCLAFLLPFLAACAPDVDPDQARVCRIALAADVDAGASIVIDDQRVMPPNDLGSGLRIDFATVEAAGRRVPHFAECRFQSTDPSGNSQDLASFGSESGTMSDVQLFFLKRFWLESPEGQRADPQPVANLSHAPWVSPVVAHALQDALNALPAMATYAMLSAAYSLVYGLANRINLAFGEMAAIGAAGCLTGVALLTEPGTVTLLLVSLAFAVWAATLHGAVISRFIFRPLSRSTGQQGLVATIGLALVLNEYLRLAQGAAPLWIPPLRSAPIALARSEGYPVTVTPLALELTAFFAIAAVAVLAIMGRSQFGRNWRALSDDPRAAALLGVSPNRVFAQTFALASALAGTAGAMVVLVYGSFGASFGTVIGLKGLLAAVLGGIGSVRGAFLGGIAISIIEALWSAFFPVEYRDLVLFSLLIVTLVVLPGGLFGDRDLRPRLV